MDIADSYDIYQSDFTLSGTLSAGTYWLTLQNGNTTSGNDISWDQDNGPSLAYFNNSLTHPGNRPNPSESFQLYGNAVPEPGTYALLGGFGLTDIGFLRRRRAR